jgi:hypothetical protein
MKHAHASSKFFVSMFASALLWAMPAHADASRLEVGSQHGSALVESSQATDWSAPVGDETLERSAEALGSPHELLRQVEPRPQADPEAFTARPRVIVITLGPIVIIIIIRA